jgi:hypothetical protein
MTLHINTWAELLLAIKDKVYLTTNGTDEMKAMPPSVYFDAGDYHGTLQIVQ